MCQSAAYSGQDTYRTKQKATGAYYVVHIYFSVLQDCRNLYKQTQEYHDGDERQNQIPVVGK